ncbi:hypothetical protein HanRHA438_Chr03g0129611 [Helianthus annuus]|nr:hypothetical protein HanRHA438_Chr03g0129611 [Helianthus annuus]KAJ0944263.1 hypothetical protein HanPSC8_Chr03g0114311 [Helianthus annuus]
MTGIPRNRSVYLVLFSHSLDLRRRNKDRRNKGSHRSPCNIAGRSEKTNGSCGLILSIG